MKHSCQDTLLKRSSLKDTAKSTIFENIPEKRSGGINSATPEDWNAIRQEHPAILMEENVFEPAHYVKEGGVECIDVMIQLYGIDRVKDWAEITAFKYQWRHGNKEGNSSEQDKMKSIWYTRFSMGDDPRDD